MGEQENAYQSRWERLRPNLMIKPIYCMAFHDQGGTRTSKLLPASERWAPKTSSFENQWGLHAWDQQGYSDLRDVSKDWCMDSPTPDPSAEAANRKTPGLSVKTDDLLILKYKPEGQAWT